MVDLSMSSDKSRASGGIRMAMSPQQFCLRWNNHQSNFVSVFEQLLHTEQFVDVTIAVEGRTLKAHKMVLSACSPYFQGVLASHPDKHPIVILKDVRYTDMRDLLDFMYRGEASVDQENLPTFLRVAECLRIKGLTEVGDKRGESIPSPYLIQQGLSTSNSTNVSSNGSIAIAPPSVLPGAPLTPLPGDPPPLKRPPLSPTTTGAKRRRGRPPKISGEDSETDVGVSHDEESRSGSGVSLSGAPVPANVAVETEIKTESDDPADHKDSDGSRPPSHQAEETKAGPSGESVARDLSKSSTEDSESTRQSPGSGWSFPFFTPEVSLIPPLSLNNLEMQLDLPEMTAKDQNFFMETSSSSKVSPTMPMPQSPTNFFAAANSISSQSFAPPIEIYSTGPSSVKQKSKTSSYSGFPPSVSNQSTDSSCSASISSNANMASSLSTPTSSFSMGMSLPGTELLGVDCNGLEEAGVQMGIKVRGLDLMRYGRLENGVYKCTECERMRVNKTFKTSYSFQRHAYLYHEGLPKRFPCPVCQKEFSRPDKRKSHLKEKHGLLHGEPIESILDFTSSI